jgi:hypothetical protein
MVENKSTTFRCNICNKNYKDKSGLWYHNNKYHVAEKKLHSSNSSSFSTFPSSKSSILFSNEKSSKITCSKCNKTFSRSDNLKRHQKNCISTDTTILNLVTENEILKQHLKKQEEMMNQLIESINKNAKIHPGSKNHEALDFV